MDALFRLIPSVVFNSRRNIKSCRVLKPATLESCRRDGTLEKDHWLRVHVNHMVMAADNLEFLISKLCFNHALEVWPVMHRRLCQSGEAVPTYLIYMQIHIPHKKSSWLLNGAKNGVQSVKPSMQRSISFESDLCAWAVARPYNAPMIPLVLKIDKMWRESYRLRSFMMSRVFQMFPLPKKQWLHRRLLKSPCCFMKSFLQD